MKMASRKARTPCRRGTKEHSEGTMDLARESLSQRERLWEHEHAESTEEHKKESNPDGL